MSATFPKRPRRVVIGATREDPPRVFVATNEATLSHVLAIQLVAAEDPSVFDADARANLQSALMHERWADAVVIWIEATGISVDVYPDEPLHDPTTVDAERTMMEIRVGRVFFEERDQQQ